MNLEQLNKTQLVLLALLVSFVTSIATGIVTVTLVNQAPTDVIRTTSHVVEKTVERVVPGETKIVETIKEVSNPTESDMAVAAVEKNKNIVVSIKGEGPGETRGFFVSSKGEIVAPIIAGTEEGENVAITWPGNTSTTTPSLAGKVKKISAESSLMLITLDEVPKSNISYANLVQATVPTLGSGVITVGYSGKSGTVLEFGKVTSIVDKEVAEGSRRFVVSPEGSAAQVGAPVIDYSGRVLGINFGPSEALGGNVILPLPAIDSVFGQVLGASVAATSTSKTAQ